MKPHRPELADVFRAHQSDFLARWDPVLSRPNLPDMDACPVCKLGRLILIELLSAEPVRIQDTS